MKTTKRIVIRKQYDEVLVVRNAKVAAQGWCEECAAVAILLTPEAASAALSMTPRAVYRLVESDEVHFNESRDGTLLVCLRSLLSNAQPHEHTTAPEVC